jgi:hypothetical protein
MEDSADSGLASSVPARLVISEVVGTHLGTNQTLDLRHGSVSSPDLNKPPTPAADVSVSRTRTLPLRSTRRISTGVPTLQGATFDVENLEHLRRWVLGLAIVDFDLEQGPSLTCVFPLFPLYPFEAENIAFSAFPDSTIFKEGSDIHSFRIREQVKTNQGGPALFDGRRAPSPDGFVYGFSHFNQEKCPTSKRGYSQVLSPDHAMTSSHRYRGALWC